MNLSYQITLLALCLMAAHRGFAQARDENSPTFLHSKEEHQRQLQSNSVTLPNGADLTVALLSPDTSTIQLDGTCTARVDVMGNYSIGAGVGDVSYIFVIDQSGSIDATLNQQIVTFFQGLTDRVFDEGSAKNAGVVRFGSSTAVVQALTNDRNDIKTAIANRNGRGSTNCAAGLNSAASLVTSADAGGTVIAIFAGDGECDNGPAAATAAMNLATASSTTTVVVETIAIANPGLCTTDLGDIAQSPGKCNPVDVPADFDVDQLIGTVLRSAFLQQDSNPPIQLTNQETDGPVMLSFSETIQLQNISTEICLTATGEDEGMNGEQQVQQCVTVRAQDALEPTCTCDPLTANPGTATSANFVLRVSDNCGVLSAQVQDTVSSTIFGNFSDGTRINYVVDPSGTPEMTMVTSGVVDVRITANGPGTLMGMDLDNNACMAACVAPITNPKGGNGKGKSKSKGKAMRMKKKKMNRPMKMKNMGK